MAKKFQRGMVLTLKKKKKLADFPLPRIASKLVRDNIPGNRVVVDPHEHYNLLLAKLHEEVEEVARSRTIAEMAEELGDVHEVCAAIAKLHGIEHEVGVKRMAKFANKGGFLKGVVQDGSEQWLTFNTP